MTSPFDIGLQPERTELAWRRTALALGVGSLVSLRLLPAALGSPWWALVGTAGIAISIAMWVFARARHREVTRRLHSGGDRVALPGAAALAALASLTVVIGLAGVAISLVAAAS